MIIITTSSSRSRNSYWLKKNMVIRMVIRLFSRGEVDGWCAGEAGSSTPVLRDAQTIPMPDCVKFIPRSPIDPKSHLNHAAIGVSRPWTSARGLGDSEEVLKAVRFKTWEKDCSKEKSNINGDAVPRRLNFWEFFNIKYLVHLHDASFPQAKSWATPRW